MKRNKKNNNNILIVGIAALAALGIYFFTKKDDSGSSSGSGSSGRTGSSNSGNSLYTTNNTVDSTVKNEIDENQYRKLTDDDLKYWGNSNNFLIGIAGKPIEVFERFISYSVNDIAKLINSICKDAEISLKDFWIMTNDYYLKTYNQSFANALKKELEKRGYDENLNQIKTSSNNSAKVTVYTDKKGNQIVSTSGRGGSISKPENYDDSNHYKGRSGSSSSGRS